MESAFEIIKYLFYGFFGLLGVLIVVAVLFGKRVIKKWEYEADFRDDRGREIGEFDVELSRIDKQEPEFSHKTSLRLRHPSLTQHATVRVWLDELLVMEGMVTEAGRVRLGKEHVRNAVSRPETGMRCRVECNGTEIVAAELHPD